MLLLVFNVLWVIMGDYLVTAEPSWLYCLPKYPSEGCCVYFTMKKAYTCEIIEPVSVYVCAQV